MQKRHRKIRTPEKSGAIFFKFDERNEVYMLRLRRQNNGYNVYLDEDKKLIWHVQEK